MVVVLTLKAVEGTPNFSRAGASTGARPAGYPYIHEHVLGQVGSSSFFRHISHLASSLIQKSTQTILVSRPLAQMHHWHAFDAILSK
jgi:hypothetical protein